MRLLRRASVSTGDIIIKNSLLAHICVANPTMDNPGAAGRSVTIFNSDTGERGKGGYRTGKR